MAKTHPPVKLIIGFISGRKDCFLQAQKLLVRKFGEMDFQSDLIAFDFTEYYAAEMGKDLQRKFVSFRRLIKPEDLSGIKIFTNKAEKMLSSYNRRQINIDPGYLTEAKLILATTKDFSHRIFLKNDIFAEVTMFYSHSSGYEPFPWTYPDYHSPKYKKLFKEIREIYTCQIKKCSKD
ncbi:MAG: DUF4416 family protein [Elusimicrobiota bacterium]